VKKVRKNSEKSDFFRIGGVFAWEEGLFEDMREMITNSPEGNLRKKNVTWRPSTPPSDA
jgi:hypothetical protein